MKIEDGYVSAPVWQWILVVVFILAITPAILFTSLGAKIFIVSIMICLGVAPWYLIYDCHRMKKKWREEGWLKD